MNKEKFQINPDSNSKSFLLDAKTKELFKSKDIEEALKVSDEDAPDLNTIVEELFAKTKKAGINFEKIVDNIKVRVEGKNPPEPIALFEDVKEELGEKVMENIRKCKYVVPTPIQKYSLPIILQGRDILGTAQTGSGKTAAFLLPMIAGILKHGKAADEFKTEEDSEIEEAEDSDASNNEESDDDDTSVGNKRKRKTDKEEKSKKKKHASESEEEEEEEKEEEENQNEEELQNLVENFKLKQLSESASQFVAFPTAIILAPTRELAFQIHQETLKFSHNTGINSIALIGGGSRHQQLRNLMQTGCDICVATPGRLIDFIRLGYLDLSGVRYFTMDEADRMLDMGFEEQISFVMEQSKVETQKRQVLMFSATFSKDIQYLALRYLKNYVHLTVGVIGKSNTLITQKILFVKENEKRARLVQQLAEQYSSNSAIVFFKRKVTILQMEEHLNSQQIPTCSLHGDKNHAERAKILQDFKDAKYRVLLATDVAARGLDVENVELVVNYDFPQEIDTYVHRIGRTGRAGRKGTAISFFNYDSQDLAPYLYKVLDDARQEVPVWLINMAQNRKKGAKTGDDVLLLKNAREEEFTSFNKLNFAEQLEQTDTTTTTFDFSFDAMMNSNEEATTAEGNTIPNGEELEEFAFKASQQDASLDSQKSNASQQRGMWSLQKMQWNDSILSLRFPLNAHHVLQTKLQQYQNKSISNLKTTIFVTGIPGSGADQYSDHDLKHHLSRFAKPYRIYLGGERTWFRRYAILYMYNQDDYAKVLNGAKKDQFQNHTLHYKGLQTGETVSVHHTTVKVTLNEMDVSKEELRTFFVKCGPIVDVNIVQNFLRDKEKFGYVEFEDESSAQQALRLRDLLKGQKVFMELAYIVHKSVNFPKYAMIKSVDRSISTMEVLQVFSRCGKIVQYQQYPALDTRKSIYIIKFETTDAVLRACWKTGTPLGRFNLLVSVSDITIQEVESVKLNEGKTKVETAKQEVEEEGEEEEKKPELDLDTFPEKEFFLATFIKSNGTLFKNPYLAKKFGDDEMHKRATNNRNRLYYVASSAIRKLEKRQERETEKLKQAKADLIKKTRLRYDKQ